jgi:hypothetical protein
VDFAPVFTAGRVFFAAVWGTPWRVIGRGLGNGTLGWAAASTANADNPTASAKLVAKAVVRNAAALADRVTSFLGGESSKHSSFKCISIEYVDKILKSLKSALVCQVCPCVPRQRQNRGWSRPFAAGPDPI